MDKMNFNMGQRFRYHGKEYTITGKHGLPAAPSIRIRSVSTGGYFFLEELREWARAGLIEFLD